MRALESLEKSLRELPTRELQRYLYRELPTIEKILIFFNINIFLYNQIFYDYHTATASRTGCGALMETTDVVFDNLNYIFYFFELFIVDKDSII